MMPDVLDFSLLRITDITVDWNSYQSVLIGNTAYSSKNDPQNFPADRACFHLDKDEKADFTIHGDRSVIEAFINNKRCLTLSITPDVTSNRIAVIPHGGDILMESADFWKMKGIFEDDEK